MRKQIRYLALADSNIAEKIPYIQSLTQKIKKLREEFMFEFPLEEEVAHEFLNLVEKIEALKNPEKE